MAYKNGEKDNMISFSVIGKPLLDQPFLFYCQCRGQIPWHIPLKRPVIDSLLVFYYREYRSIAQLKIACG